MAERRNRRRSRVRQPIPWNESVLAQDLIPTEIITQMTEALRTIGQRNDRERANRRVLDVAVAATAPARQLYELVPAVLDGDARAIEEFNTTLDLYDPGVGGHGHAHAPSRRPIGGGRPGAGTSGPNDTRGISLPEGPGTLPCAIVAPGAIGAIGLAAAVAGERAGMPVGARVDAVGRISECLGGFEAIGHAFVHDIDMLDRRVRTLGNLWRVAPDRTPMTRARRDLTRRGTSTVSRNVGPNVGLPRRPRDVGPGGRAGFGPNGGGFGPDDGPGGFGPGGFGPGGVEPGEEPGGFGPDDGFPPGFGPDDGPVWCPPVPDDDCDLVRRLCIDLILGGIRGGIANPTYAPYAVADGIAGIEPPVACPGDQVKIVGAGFGATQPDHIDVLVHTPRGCEIVAVDSWSDTEVVVTLPDDVQPGCIGFLDHDLWDAARGAVGSANASINELNEGLACLRMGTIPNLPLPGLVCPPCNGNNRIDAGLPVISHFRGPDTVEPGETITLSWNVAGATSLTVERTSSTGPTLQGATSLDVTGTMVTTSAATHSGPATLVYRLTATNLCGSVTATVTIVATRNPRLEVGSIEVTQGIQDAAHTVELVAQKRTVVRATITHELNGWGTNTVPNVTGRCRVRRNGSWTSWIDPINGTVPPVATPGASITVVAAPDPVNTDDTLNFLLPLGWVTAGDIDVEVEARVDDFGAPSGQNGLDVRERARFGPFTFRTRQRLQVRYIRVQHDGTTPPHGDCVETIRRSMQRIPTPNADIAALPGAGTETTTTTDDVDDLLDDMDDAHNCSWWEALWEWVGADCPDDDGFYWALITGTFYRGKAAGIPANTYATANRNVTDGGSFTVFELDNKAAHEMAHCLDQLHLEVCGAQGGESPTGWPNGGQIDEIPFDIDNNTTVTEDSGIWDLMTYCNSASEGFRWSSKRRWRQMFDHIGG